MIRSAGFALIVAVACFCVSCSSSGSAPPATRTPDATPTPTVVPVTFASTRITWIASGTMVSLRADVASTPGQSERGLGYRDALPEDAGMLFDLHTTRIPQFWMKGMRFPLDMVWIGEDKRVLAITADVPARPGVPDDQLPRISPPLPVRYVLEINAGAASRQGLAAGVQLTFELPVATQ